MPLSSANRPPVTYLRTRPTPDRETYRAALEAVADLLIAAEQCADRERLSVIAVAAEALIVARRTQGHGMMWPDGLDVEIGVFSAAHIRARTILECALVAAETELARVKLALSE